MTSTTLVENTLIHIHAKDEQFIPFYASEHAAGADVKACIEKPITLMPQEFQAIPIGLHFALPPHYEIQVRPRSGLASKYGVTVLNTPGTIDSDFRGEVQVILINHGKEPFTIERGMRIAQIVIGSTIQASFIPTHELSSSKRGAGGFGHTGLF